MVVFGRWIKKSKEEEEEEEVRTQADSPNRRPCSVLVPVSQIGTSLSEAFMFATLGRAHSLCVSAVKHKIFFLFVHDASSLRGGTWMAQ
jgi:hypothetical protein